MSYGLNIWSRKKEYHKFVTSDLALLTMGIGTYNLSSAETFCKPSNAQSNPELLEFFGQSFGTLKNSLLGVGQEGSIKIQQFDLEEKIYKEVIGLPQIFKLSIQKYPPERFNPQVNEATIETFLKKWNAIQSGRVIDEYGQTLDEKTKNTYKAVVDKINNSQEGCLTFDCTITALGVQRVAKIKLYLLYNQDSETSRVITLNGAPMISAIPTTPYGSSYSGPSSLNSSAGIYQNATTDNIGDRVAGQLRTTYDPSTGQFESGTQQIMARLLDDLDPADQPELTTEQLSSLSRDDVYNGPEGLGYMGNFSKGRAVPLSAERGNPHLFGPDFKGGCENPTTKAIITVINRLGQSYKAGDIVVCSRLIGEGGNWVIVSAGAPAEKKGKFISFGSFDFSRWLVSASNFFSSNNGTKIMPDSYLTKIRADHYISSVEMPGWKSDLANVPNTVSSNSISLSYTDITLNLIASIMPTDISDPISYLESGIKNPALVTQVNTLANIDRLVDSNIIGSQTIKSYLNDQIVGLSTTRTYHHIPHILTTDDEPSINGFLPKNASSNNARNLYYYLSDDDGQTQSPQDITPMKDDNPVYASRAPFWGILFPDGYTTNSVNNLLSQGNSSHLYLKNSPLFKNDPNKIELDASAGLSYIDLKTNDPVDNYLFASNVIDYYGVESNLINNGPGGQSSVFGIGAFKKMGAVSSMQSAIGIYLNKFFSVPYAPGFGYDTRSFYLTGPNFVNNLEPLNPAKIQFSPMSMDLLYSQSLIAGGAEQTPTLWQYQWSANQWLKRNFARLILDNNGVLSNEIVKMSDYYAKLWAGIISDSKYSDSYKDVTTGLIVLNQYNSSTLLWDNAFKFGPNNEPYTLNRHPSPLGTFYNAIPAGRKEAMYSASLATPGSHRSPVVPILACKSKIATTASTLSFTVNQLLGMSPQLFISPSKPPSVVVLPFSAGLTWVDDPGIPSAQQKRVQWGDRTKTDAIDSFGTSALHVRVYEHWPENQTLFMAPIFTVLHFNPVDTPYKFIVQDVKDNTNTIVGSRIEAELGNDGQQIPKRSSVDFKEPVFKNSGAEIDFGTVVSSGNLAPFSEWKWNPKRRGALLSGGGFAYTKKVVGVEPTSIKLDVNTNNGSTLGGKDYMVGDLFTYGDGTTIEVTSVGARSINGVQVENSIISFKVTKDGTNGITSVTNDKIQPAYIGTAGTGARFGQVTFKVKMAIGYDPAPKEVIGISRLTKPSSNGESIADGTITTNLTISDTSKKQYDIYYFFHNDPTHYSADETHPYNGGWLQHATVEVAGA